jgi:hypothetical protein
VRGDILTNDAHGEPLDDGAHAWGAEAFVVLAPSGYAGIGREFHKVVVAPTRIAGQRLNGFTFMVFQVEFPDYPAVALILPDFLPDDAQAPATSSGISNSAKMRSCPERWHEHGVAAFPQTAFFFRSTDSSMKNGTRRALWRRAASRCWEQACFHGEFFDQRLFGAGTGAAYDPWKNWDARPSSGPLHLVHAAILAANPHNSQPWMFSVAQDTIDVYADTRRNIGMIDPALRRDVHGNRMCPGKPACRGGPRRLCNDGRAVTRPGEPAACCEVSRPRACCPGSEAELYAAIPAAAYQSRSLRSSPGCLRRQLAPAIFPSLWRGPARMCALVWFSTPAQAAKRSCDQIVALGNGKQIIGDRQPKVADSGKWYSPQTVAGAFSMRAMATRSMR